MSVDDLERAGLTLPREQWGGRKVRHTVNKPLFVAAAVLAASATFLMYFGDGRLPTWAGALLFLLALVSATSISLLAVSRQGGSTAIARRSVKRKAPPTVRN